jgi:hypothetical protein
MSPLVAGMDAAKSCTDAATAPSEWRAAFDARTMQYSRREFGTSFRLTESCVSPGKHEHFEAITGASYPLKNAKRWNWLGVV